MSTTYNSQSLTIERHGVVGWWSVLTDFVELSKPRISVLVLVTVAVSAYVADWGQLSPFVLFHALLGTTLVAASASTFNQWIERDRDRFMERTADRPLPSGRISSSQAIVFGVATMLLGMGHILFWLNASTALWALMTWVVYVLIYTPLKTRTRWNTAIGAIAGALPIWIGWSAGGQAIDIRAMALFFVVFLWQFPHFMAIAWIYKEQYANAGMKMLPVVDPQGHRVGLQAVLAALAILPVSLVPAIYSTDWGGIAYMLVALSLGTIQMGFAWRFWIKLSKSNARHLLWSTLIYLPVLFIALLFGIP